MSIIRFILIISCLCVATVSSYAEEIEYGNNKKAGNSAEINGINFYYEIYGSGEPVLLIHGNGLSIAAMRYQIAHFAKKNKVIVVDSRGHGKSGLGKGKLTYFQMMEDYNALLDKLNTKPAYILGWSDGGILALLLAINHPEKASKLALMGTNLRAGNTAVYNWTGELLDPISNMINEKVKTGDKSEDWNHQKQLMDLLLTQPNISVESISKIQVPVLVMAGDKDIIRSEHTLEIFNNLPNAHLAILPGQTHWAPVIDPVTFNRLVDKFFSDDYSRPTSEEILKAALENH